MSDLSSFSIGYRNFAMSTKKSTSKISRNLKLFYNLPMSPLRELTEDRMSYVNSSSFSNGTAPVKTEAWYAQEIDKLDPDANWQFDQLMNQSGTEIHIKNRISGQSLTAVKRPGAGIYQTLYEFLAPPVLTKKPVNAMTMAEVSSELNSIDPNLHWTSGAYINSTSKVEIYFDGQLYCYADAPGGYTPHMALLEYLRAHVKPAATKLVQFKPAHTCEYRNQGLNTIVMACKHCGKDQPEYIYNGQS